MDGEDKQSWDGLDQALKPQHAVFYPVSPLQGKMNFKRVLRIERDGSITARVFLDIGDPSHREFLICMHYLRHLARILLNADIGMNILDRDNPWDFRLGLSTGDAFNVEITAVADNEHQFEINKREERLAQLSESSTIRLLDLRKLESLFPDQSVATQIAEHDTNGVSPDDLVANPFAQESERILISHLPEPFHSLEALIRSAVDKKASKNHQGKEETVLIIDNRTSAFDMPEYRSAAGALESYFEALPFPEIWFYTGYCSDDDGSNAEFSFAPLKLTGDRQKQFEAFLSRSEIDSKGRVVY
jgi:hypothetical protein